MALTAGLRLGPYEIQTAIGAGGMGEVYRARDTRLDRTVAVKVLSAPLAADPLFRERFDREARAISALDHPNICTLYDLGTDMPPGTSEPVNFLVMQFVDGETLARRLERGPLKIAEVVRIAMEIASALDKAHRAGIVHRDLKPGNVMLTANGAKLLDFGLAKLVAPSSGVAAMTALPTREMTADGTILGTFQYMAPEQLEGGEVDARTDIFAFGTLVFEMATARKAFEGKSRASLIGAILRDDPPSIVAVRQSTRPGSSTGGSTAATTFGDSDALSAGLDRIVRRCLAKNPDDRWQTASDLLEALRWVNEGRGAIAVPIGGARRRALLERTILSALFLAAAAVAAWAWLRPEPPKAPVRFQFDLPAGDALTSNGVAISPDGRSIVVTGVHAGTSMLFRRELDQLEAVPIRGTETGEFPFFSPDGKWLGFFTPGAMKKVPIGGGPPSTITPTGNRFGASWGPDDTIAFASTSSPDIMRVPSAGGKAMPLVPAKSVDNASLRWPVWMPDGTGVLFTVFAGGLGAARIGAYSLKDGSSHIIAEGTFPLVTPGGDFLFARGASAWTAPLNPRTLAIGTSPPVPVVEGVQINNGGLALVAAHAVGTIAYESGSASDNIVMNWIGRDGVRQPLIEKPQPYRQPRVSPDGSRVAVTIFAGGDATSENASDVWTYEISTKALSRLTFGAGRHESPVWTPDSRRIIYAGDSPEKRLNLFEAAADGTGQAAQLTRSPNSQRPFAVTPDGKTLIYVEQSPGGVVSIHYIALEGDRTPHVYLQTQFNTQAPALSSDGRFLAYQSDETGRNEVYVRPFPGPGGKWQVSTNGGTAAVWSPDGKALYFYDTEGIKAASIESRESSFRSGVPKLLFPYRRPVGFSLTMSPDGQRFAVLERVSVESTPHVIVASNALPIKK
jgi:eukaryotic-like serine/threonine-protein kinase